MLATLEHITQKCVVTKEKHFHDVEENKQTLSTLTKPLSFSSIPESFRKAVVGKTPEN